MSHSEAFEELATVLGDRLQRSKAEVEAHGRSESHYPLTPPGAVAYPETTEEVAWIVRICASHGCPVTGWGAGTSLEGQGLPVAGGLSVDFARMNRVLELRGPEMDVRVQPGLTREGLDRELRESGLFFPVDPGADASLGGMAMTRASGTTTVRYGTMRDHVRALEVVLADGTVIRTGSGAKKSSSGYDLTALFVGSEGTLGLVTELTLRLHPRPEAASAAICAFGGIEGAVAAAVETVQSGLGVARIEFVDRAIVACFNMQAEADLPETPHLFVEFHGTPERVAEEAELFEAIARAHGAAGIRAATRAEERSRLWEMRHRAYWSVLAAHPGKRAITTDVCVPISRLAEAVAETQAEIAASPIEGPILGHVGDGNFHAALLIDPERAEDRQAAEHLSKNMAERALRLGGTVTGEHGIGIGKRGYMRQEHGAGWDVMAKIKRALDPEGLYNPGKLLPGN